MTDVRPHDLDCVRRDLQLEIGRLERQLSEQRHVLARVEREQRSLEWRQWFHEIWFVIGYVAIVAVALVFATALGR